MSLHVLHLLIQISKFDKTDNWPDSVWIKAPAKRFIQCAAASAAPWAFQCPVIVVFKLVAAIGPTILDLTRLKSMELNLSKGLV